MNGFSKAKWSQTEVNIDKILTYDWKISNYNYVNELNELRSPYFSIRSEEKKWYLKLEPAGGNGEDFVMVRLYWSGDLHNSFDGYCFMSVLNYKGEKIEEESIKIKPEFKDDSVCFYEPDKLWKKKNVLLANGCLTVRCEFVRINENECVHLTSEDQVPVQHKLEIIPEPSELAKLFLDDHLSDIKLVASCGESLPAHRCFLAAFSPVFQAMFVDDMREKTEGEVKIDDYEGKVLKEMLRFIYTGRVEKVASNAIQLIFLADKYLIPRRREYCEEELSKKISMDNILDILAIAQQHNIKVLRRNAICFIKAHHREIVTSEAYQSLKNIQVVITVSEVLSQMNISS